MAKQLKFSDDARQALLKGMEIVAKAVVTTLGPKGRNIALDKKWGAPNIVHDGVSVAKEIDLEDPFENMGAQLVKEAASKTNDAAGDGTTTATLLAKEITAKGMKNITAGANPMVIKKGIEKAVDLVVKELKNKAKPIKIENSDEITQVATISAGDEEIGAKIAEALKKVGGDGVISVEEGKGREIEIEYKEGMEFDKGYMSHFFVTETEKMEAEINDAYILLTNKKISSVQDLLPFLEKFVKVSKNLVIIADEIEGEALATLVVNKLRGTFNILAVKTPFGDKEETLEDIAVLTGGTVISDDTGKTFETIEVSDLGKAEKVWADKDSSKIIGGKGKKTEIEKRIKLLKRQMETSDSDYDTEKLAERLAKLSGGVAQINVGATTEIELNEKKERVKDAVGATKAAVEEGILPGGGVALLRARKVLLSLKGKNADEQVGIDIVYKALEEPLRWLAKNSGEDDGYILRKIEENKDINFGFNAANGEFGSMIEMGILDPVKVTRSALQNAASVAMMVLTTEGLVTDIPEKEPPTPMGGGMPPGMGGMGM